ncbi:hypothetical protein AADG42_15710 [Ammonicoccus fulvus]|uniref:Uncharacterized protein n=1 Tax=Ammonicoccus fulvus TaxID=3138240 RepID=A0ABZ3FU41_9ACTN
MKLVGELWALGRETVRLWWRRLPVLGSWFLIGWIGLTTGTHLSVWLGGNHRTLATLAFVGGVMIQVVATIAMVHALWRDLRSPRNFARLNHRADELHAIPDSVFRRASLSKTLLLSIGPFLAVYAVWSLIDGWVADLTIWNQAVNPSGIGEQSWSVTTDPSEFGLYLVIGVVAWIALRALGLVRDRHRSSWWRASAVFLEGLWAFCLFFITIGLLTLLWHWFYRTRVFTGLAAAWAWFIDTLPAIRLPFDVALPDAVRLLSGWLAQDLLPAVWQGVGLPLAWLALVATVYGWRGFSMADALSRSRAARLSGRLEATSWGRALRTVTSLATMDVRDKYLPVIQALRLTLRSGPVLLGAYLILYALIQFIARWLDVAVVLAAGPMDNVTRLLVQSLLTLPGSLLAQTLVVALWAATVDRGLRAALGGVREREREPELASGNEVPVLPQSGGDGVEVRG